MAKTFWLLLPIIASQAFAQFSGAIQGNVIDSTNSIVPGAVVTVTDSATGISREVPTSGEGYYRVPNLAPGKYDIRVEKPGFAVARSQGLVVGIGDIARADFTLALGNVAEQIRVEAVAPLVETEQGRVSDRVDRQQL